MKQNRLRFMINYTGKGKKELKRIHASALPLTSGWM
jgi:hypothetical protein